MSYLRQSGREWIPSSRITTVSHMWRCTKWTWSTLRLVTLPGNTTTGKAMSHSPSRNKIRHVLASSVGVGMGGGGTSDPPSPPHYGLVSGPPVNLPTGTCLSWVIGLSGGSGTGSNGPPLSSVVRMPPFSFLQSCKMADIPCSLSYPHWCWGPHGQISPSVRKYYSGGGLPALTLESRHLHIITLPFHPLTMSSLLRKNLWNFILCWQAPYISGFIFMSVTHLSHRFLMIVNHSYIHIFAISFREWFHLSNQVDLLYLLEPHTFT